MEILGILTGFLFVRFFACIAWFKNRIYRYHKNNPYNFEYPVTGYEGLIYNHYQANGNTRNRKTNRLKLGFRAKLKRKLNR
jgi:hypothetical protein